MIFIGTNYFFIMNLSQGVPIKILKWGVINNWLQKFKPWCISILEHASEVIVFDGENPKSLSLIKKLVIVYTNLQEELSKIKEDNLLIAAIMLENELKCIYLITATKLGKDNLDKVLEQHDGVIRIDSV